MPNLKEVRTRISSTESTQQITKAMKLVAATKLRKSQTAIAKMRPYAEKLNSILVNLAGSAKDDQDLKAYFEHSDLNKVLLVVLSSDRGLCGAFNANVIKTTKRIIEEKYKPNNVEVELFFIGKKAHDILKKEGLKCHTDDMGLFGELNAQTAFNVANKIIEMHASGDYDEVRIIYNEFKNAATQIMRAEKMLPVEMESFESDSAVVSDFIFEPNKEEILTDLVPRAIKTQLYKACLDSFASETGSRMVAMDKATENAGEMLDALRLQYNQARQAAITGEILEIVGGAAALEA